MSYLKRIIVFVCVLLISPIPISAVAAENETEIHSITQDTNRTILNENGSISYYVGEKLVGFVQHPSPARTQFISSEKKTSDTVDYSSGYTVLDNSSNASIPKFVDSHSNRPNSNDGNTNGFAPYRGAINKTVFEDRVDDLNIDEYNVIQTGYGGIGTVDSDSKYIWIETYPFNNGGAGKAYAKTFPIDYNNSILSDQGPITYIIGAEFKLLSTTNWWPLVLHNGQVNIFIHAGDDLDVWYSNTDHTIKADLNVGTWYHVYCIVYPQLQQYDIYLVNLETNEVVAGPIGALFSVTTATNYIMFGDDNDVYDNYGNIAWRRIYLKGISSARFFENFDDGFWYRWRNMVSEGQYAYVDQSTWDRSLIVTGDNTKTKILHTYTLDYNPSNLYSIDVYYKLGSGSMHWVRLADTGKVSVFVKTVNNYNRLCYYGKITPPPPAQPYDGDVCPNNGKMNNLQAGRWYYLHLVVTPLTSQYTIYNNDIPQSNGAIGYFPIVGPQFDYFRAGIGINDWGTVTYGQIKIVQLPQYYGPDTDKDSFSNNFEQNVDSPHIMIFSDDLDSDVYDVNHWTGDISAHGWFRGKSYKPPSLGGPTLGYGGSAGMWMTDGDSAYLPNHNDNLYSPVIDVSKLKDNTKIKAIFTLWHKMENNANYEYLKVYLERGNSLPGTPAASILLNTYTGTSSGGWLWEQNYLVPTDGVVDWETSGWSKIRLRFEFKSDNDAEVYAGCFIDNVRIFGSIDSNVIDVDGDGLKDGEEYYRWGSSPILLDTDGDYIGDYKEVTNSHMYSASHQNIYRANPSKKDIYVEMDSFTNHPIEKGANKLYLDWIRQQFFKKDMIIHIEVDSTGLTDYPSTDFDFNDHLGETGNGAFIVGTSTFYHTTNFNPSHHGIHHYVLMIDTLSGYSTAQGANACGNYCPGWMGNTAGDTGALSETNINAMVTSCNDGYNDEQYQSKVLMHELGHSFDLEDDTGTIMSYNCLGSISRDYPTNAWQNLVLNGGGRITV